MNKLAAVLVMIALAACSDKDASKSESGTAATSSNGDRSQASITLEEVASADQPIALAPSLTDGALFVAEKGGTVRPLRDGELGDPVLDISDKVSEGGEQGLLGLAFSPSSSAGYVNYTDTDGDTNIVEYKIDASGAFEPKPARTLLKVDQPYENHNGGNLAFGPDGGLYVGLGDGGAGGDPQGNAQNPNSKLGKMLRIDITEANPTATTFALGLRNPWRYSFDRKTGDLWIADVGQGDIEEINLLAADSRPGANFGWDRLEGTRPFEGEAPANAVSPVHEYDHSDGRCSVTGGYRYRGTAIPSLEGAYIYGDFCDGELRVLREDGEKWKSESLGLNVPSLSAFFEDTDGELYVLSLDGPIYRITAG